MPTPLGPEKGYRILARIQSIGGTCNAGHEAGDEFEVS